MSNRIVLVGDGRHSEAVAEAAISQGHLIELTSSDTVQVHSGAGLVAEVNFAVEDALQGNTVSDAYAADDIVMSHLAKRGDEINALITAGQDISIGDKLASAGDGTLSDVTTLATAAGVVVVAVAIEAVDLSATGAVATLAAVRVL